MSGEPLDWLGRLGLAPPGQAALFLVAALAFLPVPDADLLAVRLLHHRSILTHSVLPAVLVWWLLPGLGPAAAAGAFLGIAVHLSADLLSPSRGFGAVWWPEPVRRSLGGWSRPWLLANALAGAWLAAALLPPGAGWRWLAGGAAAAAALGYGIWNEKSWAAVAVAAAVVGGAQWARWRWLGG